VPAIGITGGIATGKSAFCECLRELLVGSARCADQTPQRGVATVQFFNADVAAREIVDLAEVKEEIAREFGADVFSGNELNREQLRAIVFASADRRSALEKILHPRIRRRWSAEAQTHRHSPNDYFFADIPLLYETGGETLCDRVVVVACAPEIQIERLLARLEGRAPSRPKKRGHDSACPSIAEEMIKSQMPLPEKISKADHVVWNDGGRDVLTAQAKLLVDLWQNEKWTTK
jgi:dephospho-CoA kinase